MLTVLDEACNACVRAHYLVTNACQACVARPCAMNCPKKAIKIAGGRARIDEDERKAVADLKSKGMTVVEVVDKTKFQAALGPTFVEFGKKFGQDNIDKIRNYK